MLLRSLTLHSFRNYKKAYFEFSSGINHIFGENAQGKSNLLEAIFFLTTGRSFRTHNLHDLIYSGDKEFYIEAHFVKNGVEQVLKILCDGVRRKIIHNATALPTLSSLLGICLGVLFSPHDHALIKGSPLERREFLDIQISQSNPFYLYHLSRFYRAMKQRNTLLKKREVATIETWEEEMARSAAYISRERQRTVDLLTHFAPSLHQNLSGGQEVLSFLYKSFSGPDQKALEEGELIKKYLSQLARLRKKELELGLTLAGPHKDDLIFFLEEREARYFASEGQQRTCVAALKIAEWLLLKQESNQTPFFCIDDAGISLDGRRELFLLDQLTQLGQVFITSPKEGLTLPLQEVSRIEVVFS